MSAVLPETLSHHLDVVEVRLLEEIRANSDAFFRAATRLGALDDATGAAYSSASTLRSAVRRASDAARRDADAVAALRRKRRNLADLADRLEAMSRAAETRRDLRVFLEAGDHAGAAEAVAELRDACDVDGIRGLACLRDVSAETAAAAERCASATTEHLCRAARVQPGATASAAGGRRRAGIVVGARHGGGARGGDAPGGARGKSRVLLRDAALGRAQGWSRTGGRDGGGCRGARPAAPVRRVSRRGGTRRESRAGVGKTRRRRRPRRVRQSRGGVRQSRGSVGGGELFFVGFVVRGGFVGV